MEQAIRRRDRRPEIINRVHGRKLTRRFLKDIARWQSQSTFLAALEGSSQATREDFDAIDEERTAMLEAAQDALQEFDRLTQGIPSSEPLIDVRAALLNVQGRLIDAELNSANNRDALMVDRNLHTPRKLPDGRLKLPRGSHSQESTPKGAHVGNKVPNVTSP